MYKVLDSKKKNIDTLIAEIEDLQKHLFIDYNAHVVVNIEDKKLAILTHKQNAKAIKAKLKEYKLLSDYELNVCYY